MKRGAKGPGGAQSTPAVTNPAPQNTTAGGPASAVTAPAPAPTVDVTIYKATYSGVPVYEFIAKGIACMRRRSDGWLNATQILKVADFDKPQRTRILEREVQRGLHEKVQGGYGKYQGTWVPLERGREIAKLYNVEEILLPIFDFRPSTKSPPLAPKHVTAASSKPRPARANAARAAPAPRRVLKVAVPAPPSIDSVNEEEEEEEDNESVVSEIEPLMSSPAPESSPVPGDEFSDIDDGLHHPQHHPHPQHRMQQHYQIHHNHLVNDEEDVLETLPYHKEVGGTLGRKRKHMSMAHDEDYHLQPQQNQGFPLHHQSYPPHGSYHMQQPLHHDQRRRQAYSDELLDYFMSSGGGDLPSFLLHPPPDFNVNEIIDDEAHTAFHWAAAMGDLQVLDLLLRAGADITQVNARGETPLMRAVLFTNNYDRKSFPRLVEMLRSTIPHTDKFRSSVFHHIAATTLSRNKCIAARYYADVLLQKMAEIYHMNDMALQLNGQDQEGDTALTIAARNGAKKLIRSLLAYNTNPHIPNAQGQTADELIVEVEKRKAFTHQLPGYYHSSSSPYQAYFPPPSGRDRFVRPNSPPSGSLVPISQPGMAFSSYASATAPASALSHFQPPPPQPHISEAAIRATQKAIPDIADKLEALARAFDAELEEKEKDLRQARKLLEDTEREMEVIGGMYKDLERVCLAGSANGGGGGGASGKGTAEGCVEEGNGMDIMRKEIEKLRMEEEVLAQELKRQMEKRQEFELQWLVKEVGKRATAASSGPSNKNSASPRTIANGQGLDKDGNVQLGAEQQLQADAAASSRPSSAGTDTNESLEAKLAAAKELSRLQIERRELVDKIVALYARSSSSSSMFTTDSNAYSHVHTHDDMKAKISADTHQTQPQISQPHSQTQTAPNGLTPASPPSNGPILQKQVQPRQLTPPSKNSSGTGSSTNVMSMENKIAAYRRLIAHCVGLEIHRVEEILPELLRTLETPEEKDVGSAAGNPHEGIQAQAQAQMQTPQAGHGTAGRGEAGVVVGAR